MTHETLETQELTGHKNMAARCCACPKEFLACLLKRLRIAAVIVVVLRQASDDHTHANSEGYTHCG